MRAGDQDASVNEGESVVQFSLVADVKAARARRVSEAESRIDDRILPVD